MTWLLRLNPNGFSILVFHTFPGLGKWVCFVLMDAVDLQVSKSVGTLLCYILNYGHNLKARFAKYKLCCLVAQSCLTLCDPMNHSMPGLSVHHQLPEFTQTHVHRVSDVIQSSRSLSSPSPTFNLFQHQGLFKWVSSLHQVAKVLGFQPQHQSFQWTFRTDFL